MALSSAAEGTAPRWVLQAPMGEACGSKVSIGGRPSIVYVWVLI